jgi:Ca2+-binding RTX toxin-like protein
MTARLARPLGIALTALLALPAFASASSVDSAGARLSVIDSAGVPRGTIVSLGGGGNFYEVTEGGAAMTTPTAGPCNLVAGGTAVRCPAAGVTQILVDARGGSDQVQIALSVLPAVKTLLKGGPGDDILEGGRGIDKINGGSGGDQAIGNQNRDTMTYAGVNKKIRAKIGGGFVSGSTLDGPVGSRDQIVGDIEILIGGAQRNNLNGSGAANLLIGGPKQDKLVGEGGNDRVLGRGGNDYVIGRSGNDRLVGGGDNDKHVGGNGIDRLFAKDGQLDVLIDCGPGNNALERVKYDVNLDNPPLNC